MVGKNRVINMAPGGERGPKERRKNNTTGGVLTGVIGMVLETMVYLVYSRNKLTHSPLPTTPLVYPPTKDKVLVFLL